MSEELPQSSLHLELNGGPAESCTRVLMAQSGSEQSSGRLPPCLTPRSVWTRFYTLFDFGDCYVVLAAAAGKKLAIGTECYRPCATLEFCHELADSVALCHLNRLKRGTDHQGSKRGR
jgi:hypothetical protein